MFNNDFGIYKNYKRLQAQQELMNPANKVAQLEQKQPAPVKSFTPEDKTRYDELRKQIALEQQQKENK